MNEPELHAAVTEAQSGDERRLQDLWPQLWALSMSSATKKWPNSQFDVESAVADSLRRAIKAWRPGSAPFLPFLNMLVWRRMSTLRKSFMLPKNHHEAVHIDDPGAEDDRRDTIYDLHAEVPGERMEEMEQVEALRERLRAVRLFTPDQRRLRDIIAEYGSKIESNRVGSLDYVKIMRLTGWNYKKVDNTIEGIRAAVRNQTKAATATMLPSSS